MSEIRHARFAGGHMQGKTLTVHFVDRGVASCSLSNAPHARFNVESESLQYVTFDEGSEEPTPDCLLSRAISLAAQKHAGQFDQGGNPYILHPIRVMMAVSTTNEKIVAVLHDVVEDTDVTLDHLSLMGFSGEIVCAVESVTHNKVSEGYLDYVSRAKKNEIGRVVKAADLRDNLDAYRLTLDGRDEERHTRYIKALRILEGK